MTKFINSTRLQNNFHFFVTWTKVGKPNCIFVLNSNILLVFFFLSSKVLKWRAVEVRRKPVFTLYYREYIHYLKSNSGWFSAIFCPWNVSSKCPAIISQPTWTTLALVLLFRGGNTLVKSLSVSSLTAPRLSGKKSKWQPKKCTFKDILHPVAL
jgi:hypothetical protein